MEKEDTKKPQSFLIMSQLLEAGQSIVVHIKINSKFGVVVRATIVIRQK